MDFQSLCIGGLCLISGLGMALFPRRIRLAAEAKVATRKDELASGEPERFFEERRTLDAYPLPATDSKWRLKGIFMSACGIAILVLPYFRPH